MSAHQDPVTIDAAVMVGDLSDLTTQQRADYYHQVCESLGLNPLTKPFEFLTLNGKLRLYALRDCTDQLRRLHGISIYITNRERMGDIYIVTARAKDRTGREDESTGAVPLGTLKGDALCNALMKAETKSKRRVTLSIAGLGWLDETELATIPGVHTDAPVMPHDTIGMSPLPVGEEGTPGAATPPATNGHRPAPERPQVTGAHPTSEQGEGLFALALESCHEDPDVLSTRIRQVMHLPAQASTSKRLLPKTMSAEQFGQLWTYYQTLLAQLQRQTEVMSRANHSPSQPSSQPTPPPAGEGPPADPPPASAGALSSAPGSADADATERDRQRLRQEVAAWDLRVTQAEIEHVITHHPYSAARGMLWTCRRQDTAA
jgi:hypothetical protein